MADNDRFTLSACVHVTEYSVSNFIVAFATAVRSLTIALHESDARLRLPTTSFLNLTPRPIRVQPVSISAGKIAGKCFRLIYDLLIALA